VDYYSNDFFDLSLITHFLAGDGDDLMGGSERNDNLWGGLGNDVTIGANNVTFVDMDFNHGRFPLNVVQISI
jgi:Ca2+-binding RTX toxin-like protein